MITREQAGRLLGAKVYDRNHTKIGNVGQLYVNTANNRPEFASVNTGLFGMHQSLVPIAEAELLGDEIVVPYDKDTVKDAPNIDTETDEPLTGTDVDQLYAYYELDDAVARDRRTGDEYTGTMMGEALIDDVALAEDPTLGDRIMRDTTTIGDDVMPRAGEHARGATGRAGLRRYSATDRAIDTDTGLDRRRRPLE